ILSYIIYYFKASNAVHGLMAGFTQFSVGHVCGKIAYIPITEILSTKYSNRVEPSNKTWLRVIAGNG
ncbi:MAG: hypothetical protein ACK56F_23080, partial [bacterium]